jgi:hypothetical protein
VKKFSEEQKRAIVKQMLAKEKPIDEIAKEHKVTSSSMYQWRKKYAPQPKHAPQMQLSSKPNKVIISPSVRIVPYGADGTSLIIVGSKVWLGTEVAMVPRNHITKEK